MFEEAASEYGHHVSKDSGLEICGDRIEFLGKVI